MVEQFTTFCTSIRAIKALQNYKYNTLYFYSNIYLIDSDSLRKHLCNLSKIPKNCNSDIKYNGSESDETDNNLHDEV